VRDHDSQLERHPKFHFSKVVFTFFLKRRRFFVNEVPWLSYFGEQCPNIHTESAGDIF